MSLEVSLVLNVSRDPYRRNRAWTPSPNPSGIYRGERPLQPPASGRSIHPQREHRIDGGCVASGQIACDERDTCESCCRDPESDGIGRRHAKEHRRQRTRRDWLTRYASTP